MTKLENYGITRKHLRGSLKYAAVVTAAGAVVLTLLGLFLGFKQPVFRLESELFYILISVPVQEFIFRGLIQTHLMKIINPAAAIILTSVAYAAIHYPNPLLVALTLTAGIAWGYSFYRKPNILGLIISHAALGEYLFLLVI